MRYKDNCFALVEDLGKVENYMGYLEIGTGGGKGCDFGGRTIL